jgi:hypothetical protein
MPHLRVHRLTSEATSAVLAGAGAAEQPTEKRPYVGMIGGGITVIARDLLDEVPLDPRFVGWGREDCAWRDALLTLTERSWRGTEPLIHLWHEPQPMPSACRTYSFPHAEALYARYHTARGDSAAMRALVAEARTAEVPPEPEPQEANRMFQYRNENNGEIVTKEARSPRFDRLPNWTLIGEGQIENPHVPADYEPPVDGETVEITVTDIIDGLSNLSDDELLDLFAATIAQVSARGLNNETPYGTGAGEDDGAESADDPEHTAEAAEQEQIESQVDPEADPADENGTDAPAEVQASAAARELAEAEDIDLSTLTGSEEGGKINVNDVREAVAAKDSAAAAS